MAFGRTMMARFEDDIDALTERFEQVDKQLEEPFSGC